MAAENVKFQVNLKTARQGLHNLYAESADEAVAQLLEFQEKVLPEILKTEELLWAGSNAAPLTVPQQAQPAREVPPTSAPAATEGRSCKHGAMTYKSGQGSDGPYYGYVCTAPKGSPDKCKNVWFKS